MNLHIIVHGKSAANPDLRQAVASIRQRGHKVSVRPTWEGGDAGILAQRAVLESADVVVAGGGDGTVNEVAMGMVTSRPGPAGLDSPAAKHGWGRCKNPIESWSQRSELNRGPADYESAALPLSYAGLPEAFRLRPKMYHMGGGPNEPVHL